MILVYAPAYRSTLRLTSRAGHISVSTTTSLGATSLALQGKAARRLCAAAIDIFDYERFLNFRQARTSMKTPSRVVGADTGAGLGPKRILDAVKQLEFSQRDIRISLTELEGLRLPVGAAQFIFDGKAREVAEEEWAARGGAGRDAPYLRLPGVSRTAEGDLRSAASVMGAWRGRIADAAVDRYRGHAASIAIRLGVAEMLARDLAARRVLVVSGMARGIDTCAHKGALAARMPTLAVWGTGIDVVYPKENKKLAEEILATGGAIVSELPMGTFPGAAKFSAPQPDPERVEHRSSGCRGGRELRHPRDRALRGRTESRLLCGSWQRDQQELVDS